MSVKVQSPQQHTQKNVVGIVLCYNHIVEYCMFGIRLSKVFPKALQILVPVKNCIHTPGLISSFFGLNFRFAKYSLTPDLSSHIYLQLILNLQKKSFEINFTYEF